MRRSPGSRFHRVGPLWPPPRHFPALALAGASFCLSPLTLAESRTLRVGHFSDEFHATVTVDSEDMDDVFRPGVVEVYETRSGRQLLRVEADELAFELREGEVPSNVHDLPYGEQSVVLYEDFNFDGKKDLALMDGQHSCYHGPSFQVYLRGKKGFSRSEAFTQLAQEYCGMFSLDAEKRRIFTMTKSGCCWHQFNTYQVVHRAPKLLESIEVGLAAFSTAYSHTVIAGAKSSSFFSLEPLDEAMLQRILSFELAPRNESPKGKKAPAKAVKGKPSPEKRRVEIFLDADTLEYALISGEDERVEFSYLLDVVGNRGEEPKEGLPPLHWDRAAGTLSFHNGGYQYVVHDRPDRLGVEVIHAGRSLFLRGIDSTRNGALNALEGKKITNLDSTPTNP